jgi:hypothetical protein
MLYPEAGKAFDLNDEEGGGLQGFPPPPGSPPARTLEHLREGFEGSGEFLALAD